MRVKPVTGALLSIWLRCTLRDRGLHSSTFWLNLSRFSHTSPVSPSLIDWVKIVELKVDESKPLLPVAA